MEKLVNLFPGRLASRKKRGFFLEPVEPVNLPANFHRGSNVHADDVSDGAALDSPSTGRCL
jgi:hypothetical protein